MGDKDSPISANWGAGRGREGVKFFYSYFFFILLFIFFLCFCFLAVVLSIMSALCFIQDIVQKALFSEKQAI